MYQTSGGTGCHDMVHCCASWRPLTLGITNCRIIVLSELCSPRAKGYTGRGIFIAGPKTNATLNALGKCFPLSGPLSPDV